MKLENQKARKKTKGEMYTYMGPRLLKFAPASLFTPHQQADSLREREISL